ncbi:Uma2 family endonuclease [Paenibacillus sp. PAMC21692]|uniref:Uma2 family endonuclease n=1 Tax=Paenibacillus sp. PAMC21692 TaxID=2762320 RepID=UPI00164E79E3|nr:Uma2 family endonuclease [Paenibacillus sp. PAMC21692]QNK56543.1 Uma2 family endonuclease [Paenibacillus sp. PAMC21692]
MDRNPKQKTADKVLEPPVTYEMYAEWPDDGQRYEIVDGIMELMSPGPSTTHQAVSGELEFIFKQSCRKDYLVFHAPIDVILSETTVVQPDILMIHRSRGHVVTKRGIEGPPDLVIEILSPSSHKRDKLVKRKAYAVHGVAEYWIVDIEARTLEQHHLLEDGRYELMNLFEGKDTVVSDKIPCVGFVMEDIFREIADWNR